MKLVNIILSLAFVLMVVFGLGFALIVGFKGPEMNPAILEASLYDDRYVYQLSFYKDSSCVNEITGMFFYQEEVHGTYFLKDSNTIHFTKVPYELEGFIPEELFIDRDRKVLTFSPKPEKLYDMSTFYISKIRI